MKEIIPLTKPFKQSLLLPGSKSLTNRALIMAALCEGNATLNGLLDSDDTLACKVALKEMFISKQLYCKDAGTVARFLPPVCAALGGTYHFDANSRLRERPIKPLIDLLKKQGVTFEFTDQSNQMPFILHSSGMEGGKVFIDIQDSSQFLSGLCIAAPLTQQGMTIQSNQSIQQKPYVMMTLNLMAQFGISHQFHDEFTVEIPPSTYQATHLNIEPDASTASYFFAAAALIGSTIEIKNLTLESSQNDLKFLKVMEKIGCQIIANDHGITLDGTKSIVACSPLIRPSGSFSHEGRREPLPHPPFENPLPQGGNEDCINMGGFSDTFMTLAILAPFFKTPTTIEGIRHTRLQESDRIEAMVDGLNRLSIKTKTTEDSLTIFPGLPIGNTIHSYNDHRIAMAFSILGLKIPGIRIDNPDCVSKTCPSFFDYLETLRR